MALNKPALSIIIPVFNNALNIPKLIKNLLSLVPNLPQTEIIFIDDGSQDDSVASIQNQAKLLIQKKVAIKLVLHTRNFGSFEAIRSGLIHANGKVCLNYSADNQEPIMLILDIYKKLSTQSTSIAFGVRTKRSDPNLGQLFSRLYWYINHKFISDQIPSRGVDIIGLNRDVINFINANSEKNTSLINQLVWSGYPIIYVQYERLPRHTGKSSWTLKKKAKYFFDSIFTFTTIPIQLLIITGLVELLISVIFSLIVIFMKLTGTIALPGYTATVVIITFFAGLNSIGLGIIGMYVWHIYENTLSRPLAVIKKAYYL